MRIVRRGDDDDPRKLGVRKSDPDTSHAAASNPKYLVRAGTQRYKLLLTYTQGSHTADEAQELSGVDVRSCYWKRLSELREDGYLRRIGERNGQMVCTLTEAGAEALRRAVK